MTSCENSMVLEDFQKVVEICPSFCTKCVHCEQFYSDII